MLIIRLSRVGKPKQAQYRFIVSEKAHDPWGKSLEILGTYNPRLSSSSQFELKTDRIKYWLEKGAQCSDTVWNLFVDQKLVTGEKRKREGLSKRHKEKLAKKQTA